MGKLCIPCVTHKVGGIKDKDSSEAKMQNVPVHFQLHITWHPGQGCASLSDVFLGADQPSLGL